MRKRPNNNQEAERFLNKAISEITDTSIIKEDMHQYVSRSKWPMSEDTISPSYSEGSNLRKPVTLALKEYEWNSIERHTKTLGIQKSEWIRHAIFKLMQEEQMHCFKNNN